MGISAFEKFSGLYCSGSFIKSPSALTAMALLFEELYIPNNLQLAIEFAKYYRFTNLPERILKDSQYMNMEPAENYDIPDPLSGLSIKQQEVIKQYYRVTQEFFIYYRNLIGPFIKTNIVKEGKVFNVELVEEIMPAKLIT